VKQRLLELACLILAWELTVGMLICAPLVGNYMGLNRK
jgi:hypothetical protein